MDQEIERENSVLAKKSKTSREIKLSVFDFTDYRKYLGAFYTEKKEKQAHFSYRTFATKAGLGSPSHFQMIVKGQRNLSIKTIPKFSNALGLKEKERKFFELLVLFNQSEGNDLKSHYYIEMLKVKGATHLKNLEREKYEFLSRWYVVAIYVLVDLPSFKYDPSWIVKKLKNKISVKQAQEALELIEKLGLITIDSQGKYKQTHGPINTDDDSRSVAIYNYHQQMINLALQSLKSSELHEREMNGVTIPIPKDKLPLLKEKIRKFRNEINELASSLENPDEVYQLNVQLFSLTEEKSK